MFYAFVGNKGAGKSYGASTMIRDELRHTERLILTNVPLNLGKVQAWCDKHIEHKTVDVSQRIVMLDQHQLCEFWLYCRAGKITEKQSVATAGGDVIVPDFSKRSGDGGCFYVIDEAHIPFPSDGWVAVAKYALFYCTQERKLGDDTVFCSQQPGQMAKPLRGLMQEWVETQNMGMQPIMGCRFPGKFKWRYTLRMPGTVGSELALRHTYVKLDKEWADCYDTNAGIGVVGRGHKEAVRYGVRWQYWLAMVGGSLCLGVFLVYAGVKYGISAAKDGLVSMIGINVPVEGKATSKVIDMVSATGPAQPKLSVAPVDVNKITFASNETIQVRNNTVQAGKVEKEKEPDLTIDGWSQGVGGLKVFISDGQVISGRDPRLTSITQRGVIFEGKLLRYSKRPVGPPAVVEVPSSPPESVSLSKTWEIGDFSKVRPQ